MKIAILGGAFDPIHIGHYLVAEQIKERLGMDEIWFMVCYSYFPEFPEKQKRITSFKERFHMASLYADKSFFVSDFEQKYNKRSRTIDTLHLLQKQRPNDTFYWIIGSDALPTFQLWNDWKKLVHDHNIIIFPRDTDSKTLKKRVCKSFSISKIPPNVTVMEGDLIVSTISSTHIRERVKNGLPITPFVGDNLKSYITKKKLYTG